MVTARLRLGQLLVDARLVTPESLDEVLAIQKSDGRRLGTLLVERGLINETQLTQILSHQLSVPWVSLLHIEFSRQLLNLVPHDVAERYCLVPIYVRHVRGQGDTLYVAMDDPSNEEGLGECAHFSGLPVRSMIAPPADIRSAIRVYYGGKPTPKPATAPAPPDEAAQPEAPVHVAQTSWVPPSEGTSRTRRSRRAVASAEPASPLASVDPTQPQAALAAPEPQVAPAEVAPLELAPAVASAPPPPEEPSLPPQSGPSSAPATGPTTLPAGPERAHRRGLQGLLAAMSDAPLPVDPADTEMASQPPPPRAPSAAPAPRRVPKMVSLTLLDGTTISLPSRGGKSRGATPSSPTASDAPPARITDAPPSSEGDSALTARDLIAALRAVSHGADASEILGSGTRWEAMFAALLSLMLKKHLIADWEFVEELKKI